MTSTIGTGFVPADALARLGSESDAGDEASDLMQTYCTLFCFDLTVRFERGNKAIKYLHHPRRQTRTGM